MLYPEQQEKKKKKKKKSIRRRLLLLSSKLGRAVKTPGLSWGYFRGQFPADCQLLAIISHKKGITEEEEEVHPPPPSAPLLQARPRGNIYAYLDMYSYIYIHTIFHFIHTVIIVIIYHYICYYIYTYICVYPHVSEVHPEAPSAALLQARPRGNIYIYTCRDRYRYINIVIIYYT